MQDISRADVYFNLHRKVWSLKDRNTGLVAAHCRGVVFNHACEFVVSEAGRKRVLAEKKKNVHAFVRGGFPLMFGTDALLEYWERICAECALDPVMYNPYKGPTFYRKTDGAPVNVADSVVMLAREGEPPKVFAARANWRE